MAEISIEQSSILAQALTGTLPSVSQQAMLGSLTELARQLATCGPADHYQFMLDAGLSVGEIQRVCDVADGKPDFIEFRQILSEANLTDAGNAECLAALFTGHLRFCHTRRKWLRWDGARWALDVEGEINRAAINTARARYHSAPAISDLALRERLSRWAITSENAGRIETAISIARSLDTFKTTIEQYDSNLMLSGSLNATIDLCTTIGRAPDRADYISMHLGASYDPNASCPRWKQILSEIFNNDTELIAYIQRTFGYSLAGDTREQKLFLCYGGGANGKSVFLDILVWLLDDYAAVTSFHTFDAGRRSESTNDLATLKGKRVVVVIETNEDRRLDEARVKTVTGQDVITCRFLYGEYFEYRPQFKLWLAMNHKPVIRGTDRGIWRRIHLIPFTQNFELRADSQLSLKLKTELPGILNWALEGLRAWHDQGIGTCRAVREATEDYRSESDIVAQWLEEHTESGNSYYMPATAAYKSYHAWCIDTGVRPFSMTLWGRRMAEKGFIKERSRSGVVYHCLRIKPAQKEGHLL